MEHTGMERRLKPRFNAELPCGVSLTEAERDILFPDARLECRTRDLSESGVGVVSDSIYLGYTCVVDEGRALLLTLELPGGAIELEATAAHYVRLDNSGGEPSYLIGLRINSMSDEDRARYSAHLDSLNRREKD